MTFAESNGARMHPTANVDFKRSSSSAQQVPRALLKNLRADLLADLEARLSRGESLDDQVLPMLHQALAAERLIDASLGFIVADMAGPMTLGFVKGFPPDVVKRCLTLDFGQAVCGTVASTRKAMHVTDIQRSLDPLAELVRAAGINAYACEPLIVGDELVGTLSFASRSRRRFDPEDLAFFRQIARHVAQARCRMRQADHAS